MLVVSDSCQISWDPCCSSFICYLTFGLLSVWARDNYALGLQAAQCLDLVKPGEYPGTRQGCYLLAEFMHYMVHLHQIMCNPKVGHL